MTLVVKKLIKGIEPGILVVLVISLLLSVFVVLKDGHIYGGDTGLMPNPAQTSFYNKYIYQDSSGFGNTIIETPRMLVNMLSSLPTSVFNLEFNNFTIKILFLIPYIFISLLGSYILFRFYLKSAIPSIVGAIIYTINPFVLNTVYMGHIHALIPFALFPILIYISKCQKEINIRIALIPFLGSSLYDVRYVYIFLLISTILFISNGRDYIKRNIKKIILLYIILFAFNLYWILPGIYLFVNNKVSPTLNLISRSTFGDEYISLSRSITGVNSFWGFRNVEIFTIQPINIYWYTFAIISLISFFLSFKNRKEKKKNILFFVFLLVGIFLTKSNNAPISHSFDFLRKVVPGFTLFRDASRLFFMVWCAYGYFTGYLLTKLGHFWKSILLLLVVLLEISFTNPIHNVKDQNIFQGRNYTADELALNNILCGDNTKQGRILFIPKWKNGECFSSNNPAINYDADIYRDTNRHTTFKDNPEKFVTENSIKYIVVNDLKTHSDEIFMGIPTIIVVGKYENVILFENTLQKPIFEITFQQTNSVKKTSVSKISPTLYNLSLEPKNEKYNFNLRYNFDENWILIPKSQNLLSLNLYKKKQSWYIHSSDKNGFNLWEINTNELCNDNVVKCNDNRTVELRLIPQALMTFGLILSIIVLVPTVFLYRRFNKKYKNSEKQKYK